MYKLDLLMSAQRLPLVKMAFLVLTWAHGLKGLLMLIRSMAPEVVATDEIGRVEDVAAIQEAIYAGVSIITTVHSRTLHDLYERPYIGELVKHKAFDRYIILSNRLGPGTIEEIYNTDHEKIHTYSNEVKVCG